jgi:hypothetical protein
VVSLSSLTISGKHSHRKQNEFRRPSTDTFPPRLLDKIAKDIMVCENKTVTRWDGSIGEYKKNLQKKMIASGAV